MYILLRLSIFLILYSQNAICVILRTKQGVLNGETLVSRDGRPFYAFSRIPYAEPPIGDLRFKNPVPAKSWDGIRDATVWSPACISHHGNTGVIGQEDCLYLNVYTPKITNDTLLPVMVFIYGGRFMYGDTQLDKYGPHYFMDKDIVLITFHYRLGSLGFLSTEDEVIPGNYGLKDAIAVLQWVQNHIDAFGGDKSRVTVFGSSSGGMSTSLVLISPLAKGLFHRAISQSGYPLELETTPGIAKRIAWKFASLVGCDNENISSSEALLICLKKLPAEKLVENNSKLFTLGYLLPHFPWGPVIENEKDPNAFLVDEPQKLISRQTDIPWMFGMNTDDGAMFAILSYFNPVSSEGVIEELEKNYRKHFPILFHYDHEASNSEQLDTLTEIYKKYYFGDKTFQDNVYGFSKMATYMKYLRDIKNLVKLYKGPKYVYYYDYRNKVGTIGTKYGKYDIEMGVCHGDELISMYNWSSLITPVSEGTDLAVSKQVVQLWTNFAAKGDPNEDGDELWKPVDSSDINYLHIHGGPFEMKNELLKSELEFLESVHTDGIS